MVRSMSHAIAHIPDLELPAPYYDSQGVTLYKGDCLELLPLFADETFDMVFADPRVVQDQPAARLQLRPQ